MYNRAARSLTLKVGSTADHVGPGAYDADPNSLRRNAQDGYAPFMSMTTRNFSLIAGDSILAAPGPGQYDPRAPQDKVKGGVSVGTREKRFKEVKNDIPGPGAYSYASEIGVDKRQTASAPVADNKPKFKHVTYHRQALAPSIPSPGQAFGFEESDDGSLKKQQPPPADTSIGPAFYSVSQDDVTTTQLYKGIHFGRMTSKRTDFSSARIGPGPGQYEYKSSIVINSDNSSSAEKRKPELKIARFTEKIVQDEERRCIPGPGKYDVKGEFDKKRQEVEMSADIEHPPFGVQARRFNPLKIDGPAPGAYMDPRTALDACRRVTSLKQSPFGQTSVRFASDWDAKRAPGPGSYNMAGMGAELVRKAQRSVRQKGAFGSTVSRSKPLVSKTEIENPGPADYQVKEKPFVSPYQQASSNFVSHTQRFVDKVIDKDKENQPSPGSYDVIRSFHNSQVHVPHAAPRSEHAKKAQSSFKSTSTRFAPPRDIVLAEADPTMPGPGSYDVDTAGQKAAKNNAGLLARSARFKDTIIDNPGPATYELSPLLQDTVIQGSFNVTLNNNMHRRMKLLGDNATARRLVEA